MENNKTQELYRRAKMIIPGGTQLLSKRPEMFAPDQWPAYFSRAEGCEVWDLDGKHYYDMASNGIGACLLGFNDRDISKAVIRRIDSGSMCTLNPPEEVELAELLCDIHPWAERVRFTRTGGETASVAIRIARATTDRSMVAVCGYHGWQDWYLAANLGESDALRGHHLPGLEPFGVPVELRNTTLTFKYNDKEEFKKIMDAYGDKLAAVIMEPCRYNDPEPGFLELVKESTRKYGALLIFDEITIGWRLTYGGAHLKLGASPDMAIFAKALGNGHPIGAVIGTKDAMEGAHKSFISSTYWTESVGPAAALATLQKLKRVKAYEHVAYIGSLITKQWRKCAHTSGLSISAGEGYPCLAHFSFNDENGEILRTLYTQMMLERGFLGTLSIYPTVSHNEKIVEKYSRAIEEVFNNIALLVKKGDLTAYLKGPVAHSGFRRLN
ncbi:MAG: aminotransferase class III-fold pyridoxal phosphate-dependent enzyme [Ruminiclostridium sp.]|nr:aminotransferase class III-fold pyridoxal phosphate-dependent enzyme [Ruminiclostridium sp.]